MQNNFNDREIDRLERDNRDDREKEEESPRDDEAGYIPPPAADWDEDEADAPLPPAPSANKMYIDPDKPWKR